MTIDAGVQEQVLTGLAFGLKEVCPDAVLTDEWLLEPKVGFVRCGAYGACWEHGVDASSWPAMAAEAVRSGTSMYDITGCYPEKGEIYFGTAKAEQNGETLQLRAHVEHGFSTGTHTYICVVWVKSSEGVTVTRCAAGFSGCYNPSEFHALGLDENERVQPPPYGIGFEE
ncbi:MAG TPA: hypothetical protein VFZ48_02090 [Candidatus Saccharimonadales bacterium]